MARAGRIAKSLEHKLRDLDDHLYLLAIALEGLLHDSAYLKSIAAELRTLVCYSGRTEGLLWRLADELYVSDLMKLKYFSDVNVSHPLNQGVFYWVIPLDRPEEGHPRIEAVDVSLKYLIKECTAVFVCDKELTHEYLIKAVAQQMGSAHEDDGLEPSLANLSEIFVNGIQPFTEVLAKDSDFVIEIGERVLEHAVANHSYHKKAR